MAENEEIKVKDLPDVQSVQTSNEIMVLTDAVNNAVSNITIEDFETSIISADADNNLTLGADNKFYTKSYDADIANLQDLSALDADGKALINNSKALETGSVSNNADIYADIYKYAHSTYDSTKFTTTGTPTITNDGIASGFSASDYINNTLSGLPASINKVAIRCNFTYTTSASTQAIWGTAGNNNSPRLHIESSGKAHFYLYDGSHTQNGTVDLVGDYGVQNGDKISTLAIYSNATVEVYLQINDGETHHITFTNSSMNANFVTAMANLYIGHFGSSYSSCPIDLKSIAVWFDDVLFFNGNKTGIDVVKPDNYTVVGTPTVTTDGVASGFSTSNYLKILNSIFSNIGNKSWKIEWSGNLSEKTPSPYPRILGDNHESTNSFINCGHFNYSDNWFFNVCVNDSGTPTLSSTAYLSTQTSDNNKPYSSYIEYTGTKYTMGLKTYSDATYRTVDINETNPIMPQTNDLALGYAMSTGSIDLNTFKIYVDGSLVYQPCLKIPYNISKTGSKVVDVYARNRVVSMYEQFGYAPYYTIDEVNQTYTLPMGEIYGLTLNQSTPHIVTHYKNGVDYVDTYSNGVVEQGGTCTSGTAVVFTKAYADTNYVLTIPYSAKSATGFTPSATGDWIAKG